MATNELRKRANWQTKSGAKALKTEDIFHDSLQNALVSDIYSTYELPQEDLNAIYNVDMYNVDGSLKYKWGITMDFAIRNQENGKVLFGEIKRQDGWVETTESANCCHICCNLKSGMTGFSYKQFADPRCFPMDVKIKYVEGGSHGGRF